MRIYIYFLLSMLFFIATYTLNAQNKTTEKIRLDKNQIPQFGTIKNDTPLSSEDKLLLDKINKLKADNTSSRSSELGLLIRTFNNNNGFVEKFAEPKNACITFNNSKQLNKIMSNNTSIYSGNIRSFSSATEQLGATKGRVWIAFTHGLSSPIGPDTLEIYWSDDGINFNSYASAQIGNDIFVGNDIDMEVIEKLDGTKFLWVLYTFLEGGPSGPSKIGGIVLNLNQLDGTAFSLIWPGQSNNERYYNVKITSDNSVDSSSTWLFIACSMDSAGAGGNTFYGQKFAYISQTSQVGNPSLIYRPQVLPVFWQSGDNYFRSLFTDIAYFRDSSNIPSLMFTYSNIPDSTKIWLTKSYFSGTSASFFGTIGSTYNIQNSKISAPGGIGNQQLMIVANQNWQNSGDWDLLSWKSTDGGSTWEETFIEGSSSTIDLFPSFPDIYCKWKDRNNYRVSYNLGSGMFWQSDSLMLVKSISAISNSWQASKKLSDIQFPSFSSNVGFVGSTQDDCFVLWSDLDQFELFTYTCNSATDVVDYNTGLNSFYLYDNYPNPFNPDTKIRYTIPNVGALRATSVKLKVYDVLGNEVSILVDEEKPAGSYEVNFNASDLSSGVYFYKLTAGNFVSTKKMILLR